jgi:beta-glucanase (GH16 family)
MGADDMSASRQKRNVMKMITFGIGVASVTAAVTLTLLSSNVSAIKDVAVGAGEAAASTTSLDDHFNGRAGSAAPGNLRYSIGPWPGNAQTYTTSRANVYQDGHGDLVVKAIRSKSGHWTSGRLTTAAAFYQGTFSIRAKFPDQSGMWPALWMENGGNEIDLMEIYGNHTWFDGSALHNDRYQIHEGYSMRRPVGSGWHTWTGKWNSSTIRFYEDGRLYYTAKTPPVFNNGIGMNVIINLAVGGRGGGSVPASPSSMTMLIKWISIKG